MARIVIVDDSPADLNFLAAALKPAHHHVVPVSDPEEVEHAVQREQPDLLMIDVVMPGRSGYDIVRALRRRPEFAQLKVIFVSSKGNETDVRWGMRQGAVDYVVKPYTPQDVQAVVARHVG